MIKYNRQGIYLTDGKLSDSSPSSISREEARERTIAYQIMRAHDKSGGGSKMRLMFDALMSHDITYVGVIQTARASGLTEFPVPYVLTNCHNSLCAVGGTINEDDHAFGLSAAKKYGGIYVPKNQAVCHQYMREAIASAGSMILGTDSHTRYGCYGSMGIGEGGGELAKQLLGNSYEIDAPEVVLVWLEGAPRRGVGPHDVAVSLCAELFPAGLVKNKVLEFAGPGVAALPIDYRIGIEVMTTETSCLSSIWVTDGEVQRYYENVGRPDSYRELRPQDGAYYDGYVTVDLSRQECMIALPFHPAKAVTIHELQKEPEKILKAAQDECNTALGGNCELKLTDKIDNGKVVAEQGVIVGCAGGMYGNLSEAAAILDDESTGNGLFNLTVYPASTPVALAAMRDGLLESFTKAGAVIDTCFCGPCFGAGDTPANNGLSIRHATRNFMNREGSKPGDGQIAAVALMDARSIAATARNGGVITAATDIEYEVPEREYKFDVSPYMKRIYNGFGKAEPETELRFGPNIADWPKFSPLSENLLLKLCAVIRDEVTTTDELIPSGETSSYRSNPVKLSDFTLSRRVPEYADRSKAVRAMNEQLRDGVTVSEVTEALKAMGADATAMQIASCVFALKPGDGSAREQAASCQKVLGGGANICYEYATKRYRSNLINWGLLPFTIDKEQPFDYSEDAWIYVPGIRSAVMNGEHAVKAKVYDKGAAAEITLHLPELTLDEREILAEGCLMNYYAAKLNK